MKELVTLFCHNCGAVFTFQRESPGPPVAAYECSACQQHTLIVDEVIPLDPAAIKSETETETLDRMWKAGSEEDGPVGLFKCGRCGRNFSSPMAGITQCPYCGSVGPIINPCTGHCDSCDLHEEGSDDSA